MASRLTANDARSILTLSALTCNDTNVAGSPAASRRTLRSLVRLLRIARSRGDLVATILLQQRIRAELAR